MKQNYSSVQKKGWKYRQGQEHTNLVSSRSEEAGDRIRVWCTRALSSSETHVKIQHLLNIRDICTGVLYFKMVKKYWLDRRMAAQVILQEINVKVISLSCFDVLGFSKFKIMAQLSTTQDRGTTNTYIEFVSKKN